MTTHKFSHIRRVQSCKDEASARKCAERISQDITRYGQVEAPLLMAREWFPARLVLGDDIEDSGPGRGYRSTYRDYLTRAWVRKHRKEIIDSAYSIALRKIKGELHISKSAAKSILLERSRSEFFEYQEGML
ncbi:MAG: hypothetical protein E4H01_06135 [Lysobacterales bacterium]|nr:MAG: hypothetical protein E4H01_06135 [Xanthomonadales bacterium]